MHYEKLKALMKRSLWWKEKLFFKDKNFWSLLCFKDKESDENVLVFCKSEASDESTSLYLKVIRYLFLWNVKFLLQWKL